MPKLRTLLMLTILTVNIILWFLNMVFVVRRELKPIPDMEREEYPHERLKDYSKLKTDYIETRNIHYILQNSAICNNTKTVSLLYAVSSATANFANRQYIRSTFANKTYFQTHTVRVVFVLGKSSNQSCQSQILSEHRKYGDVIQGDFLDTYRNLTLKMVTAFHWITHYCPNAVAVAKIDDDTFADTVKILLTYIPTFMRGKKYIYCNNHTNVVVERKGPWNVSKNEFIHYKFYPWKFCSGYAVLLRGDIIGQLLKAVVISPFLWVDDVYFSGILPSRLKEVLFEYVENRWSRYTYNIQCFLNRSCEAVFGIVKPFALPKIWNYTINTRHAGQEF